MIATTTVLIMVNKCKQIIIMILLIIKDIFFGILEFIAKLFIVLPMLIIMAAGGPSKD